MLLERDNGSESQLSQGKGREECEAEGSTY